MQRIIQEGDLIANVRAMGELLGKSLQARLGSHKHVGNIRGRGLFWAVEFVQDKATKTPFPSKAGVSMEISELGLTKPYCMMVYPGAGTVDGVNGDHMCVQKAHSPPPLISKLLRHPHRFGLQYQVLTCRRIIAPPYTVTSEDIEFIVQSVSRLVEDYFSGHGVTVTPQK